MNAPPVLSMPRQKRNDASCKIESDIVRKGKIVSEFRDITLAEYLSNLLRDTVDHDYREAVRQANRELGKPPRD